MYFDTHAHFDENLNNDPLVEARDCGVEYVMAVAAHLKASLFYAHFVQTLPHTFFTIGLHPHDAEKVSENPLDAFLQFQNTPKLKAIGEIGLDYFYDFSQRDIQLKTFDFFLNLALKWNLPAVIHCRDKTANGQAYTDALTLLTPFAQKGGRFVMHCFAGDVEMTQHFMALDAFFGVSGMVSFKQAHNIRKIVGIFPENRILLETDTPYLAPVPHRGKDNHPKYIPLIAQCVADVRHWTRETCEKITFQNSLTFYGINPHVE